MIKFGPAGNSDLFYEQGFKHTYEAPKWVSKLGLNAFEYSFGRGVRMKQDTGEKIAAQAKEFGVSMSVHAPYYINLANDAFDKNLNYFIESSLGATYLGATRVVFHPGTRGKVSREAAFDTVKKNLKQIMSELQQSGFGHIIYCPETMGKINQIGDIEEVAELSTIADNLYPAIDFGHLNARTLGGIRTEQDYEAILNTLENVVGLEKTKNMHIHFSHIEYSKMGEVRHLTFEDMQWGPFFEPLAKLLKKRQYTPTIICESKGTQATDAVAMKKMYEEAQA